MTRLIIADDDAGLRDFYVDVIIDNMEDVEVDTASNGDELEEAVRQNDYDIALIDNSMPVKDDGLKRIPVLKELNKNLVIIMASGDYIEQEAIEAGADEFLAKPVNPYKLVKIIEKYK